MAAAAGAAWGALAAPGTWSQARDPSPGGDDTERLRAQFDAAIASGGMVTLRGQYRVSGQISNPGRIPRGDLHVRCEGEVRIQVDPRAAAFHTLLTLHTLEPHRVRLEGGPLTLDGAGRIANGVYLRHAGGRGGSVALADLAVLNCHNRDPADTNENQAILVFGRYEDVRLQRVTVDTVARSNATAGATKGITIDRIDGRCVCEGLRVARVLCPGATADADGLFLGGHTDGSAYTQRAGSILVRDAEFRDCQGRSVKLHHQAVRLERVRIHRAAVATISTADVDFQVGGGELHDCEMVYEPGPDGRWPLHPGFYPLSLQHQCPDRPQVSTVRQLVVRTREPLPRLVALTVGAEPREGGIDLQDLRLVASGPPRPDAALLGRCVVEFNAARVQAAAHAVSIRLHGLSGPFGPVPLLGYVGLPQRGPLDRLAIELANSRNETARPATALVAALSGATAASFGRVAAQGNAGWSGPP